MRAWFSCLRHFFSEPRKRNRSNHCMLGVEELEVRTVPSGSSSVSILTIDPTNGLETTVWQGASGTVVDSLAVESNGTVVFSGDSGSQAGLFQINPAATNPTLKLLDPNAPPIVTTGPSNTIYGAVTSGYSLGELGPGGFVQINPVTGGANDSLPKPHLFQLR